MHTTVGQVESAFAADYSPDSFQEAYGARKPVQDDKIIFTCRIGVRSNTAAEKLKALGFRK